MQRLCFLGRQPLVHCCGVFLAAFALYLRTACPSVYVGDAGELAVVPQVLTIAHPTGYPLYAQLGKLFLCLPFGAITYSMSVFSAVAMAVAAGCVCRCLQLILGRGVLPVIGGLSFALGQTVWSQAVIAEVYALNAAFVGILLSLMLAWLERPRKQLLLLGAFIYGLSFGHHMTTALLMPMILVTLVDWGSMERGRLIAWIEGQGAIVRNQARRLLSGPQQALEASWAIGWRVGLVGSLAIQALSDLRLVFFPGVPLFLGLVLYVKHERSLFDGAKGAVAWLGREAATIGTVFMAFAAGFSINLYQPIRSLPLTPRNAVCGLYWGRTDTFSGLVDHLNGRMFRSLMFTRSVDALEGPWKRFFFNHLLPQLTPLAVPLIIYGLWVLYRKRRRMFFPVAAVALFNIYFAINYDIPDVEVFYIPTTLVASIALSMGLKGLTERQATNAGQRRAVLACSLVPVMLLTVNYWFNDRSRYYIAHDYGMEVLNTVRGQATLLTQGWITPYIVGYLQLAHQMRTLEDERVTMIIEGRERIFQRIITGRLQLPPGFRLFTTVPLEVKGSREAFSELKGLVYEIGLNAQPVNEEDVDHWEQYMARGQELDDPSIFYDAHTRSILAKYFYLQAETRFAEDRHEEAMALCQRAIGAAPGNKQVYNNIGAIYFKYGYLQKAEEACLTALRIDPTFQQARHNLGNIYYQMGRHDKALAMFEKDQRMGARVEFFRPIVAQIFMEQGNFDAAAREFKNALVLDPNNVEIMNQLGIAYLYGREYTAARQTFEDALNLEPDKASTLNNLGLYHDALNEHDRAEDYFRRAVEIDATLADAYNNLGRLRAMKGDFTQALTYFQSAVEENARLTTAWNNLGGVHQTLGQADEARSAWERSLEIDPDQPKIADLLRSM